jgi:aspartate/tyrosine/aromatic aminotransferase
VVTTPSLRAGMIESSRIDIAGINHKNLDYLADSITAVLK